MYCLSAAHYSCPDKLLEASSCIMPSLQERESVVLLRHGLDLILLSRLAGLIFRVAPILFLYLQGNIRSNQGPYHSVEAAGAACFL